MKKKSEKIVFDEQALRAEIVRNARGVGMPLGAAEIVAEKAAKATADWVTKRSAITSDDLNRVIARETEKYSTDLAYVYKNRGKII